MHRDTLLDLWRRRHAEPTSGGDFSSFGDAALVGEDPPWSYDDLAREALSGARSVLDLGTGGGEVLLRMVPWEVPDDFTVDGYADALLDLHASDGPLAFTQRRLLLRCRR